MRERTALRSERLHKAEAQICFTSSVAADASDTKDLITRSTNVYGVSTQVRLKRPRAHSSARSSYWFIWFMSASTTPSSTSFPSMPSIVVMLTSAMPQSLETERSFAAIASSDITGTALLLISCSQSSCLCDMFRKVAAQYLRMVASSSFDS